VAESSIALGELLDLKMLPAWANEPVPRNRYEHHEGEDENRRRDDGPRRKQHRQSKSKRVERPSHRFPDRPREHRQERDRRQSPGLAPQVSVWFLPHPPALENVIAQIKENTVAYSLFALARLFLAKPERYDVRLTAPAETPLFQLGEGGAVSLDRQSLERSAFRLAQSNFYKIDVTRGEPVRGNFSNVARCKLSGTLLGPTNHHDYQKRLRGLFEQRFSRRMNFSDYQRQIEIVSDPALVEQWKEETSKITTFTALSEETPASFTSAPEAERHFRQTYLPDFIRGAQELTLDGPTSRRLTDRVLHRLIEDQWVGQTRSPSGMIQELAGQFRQSGLHVFRHRRGMVFVSPIRLRPFATDAAVSPSIKAIIEMLRATSGSNRKELAEKLIVDLAGDQLEKAKLALASDLHWLISEGHVIEFNDGSLDLPRSKASKPAKEKQPASAVEVNESQADVSGRQVEGSEPAAEPVAPRAYPPTTLSESVETAAS
jgi:hypothetical protein